MAPVWEERAAYSSLEGLPDLLVLPQECSDMSATTSLVSLSEVL